MTINEIIEIYKQVPVLSSPESKEMFSKLLKMDFDPEIHYPIAYLYLHYCRFYECEHLLSLSNKEDQTYKDLYNMLMAISEAEDGECVFPLTIPYDKWWNGPHKLPLSYKGKPLVKWFPCQITEVDCNKIYLIIGKNENGINQYGYVDLDLGKLNLEFSLPNENSNFYKDYSKKYGELGFYGTETDFVLYLKCHDMNDRTNYPPKTIAKCYNIIKPVLEEVQKRLQEFENSFYTNQS